jgi:hypothetical protein
MRMILLYSAKTLFSALALSHPPFPLKKYLGQKKI